MEFFIFCTFLAHIRLYNSIVLIPVYSGCGDEEEDGIEKHHHHAGQVEIDPDRLVLQETLALTHPGLDELHPVEDVEAVDEEDGEGEEGAGAPTNQGVDEELEESGATSGYLGVEEGPAQINTHDGHPAEHREGEPVASVTWRENYITS